MLQLINESVTINRYTEINGDDDDHQMITISVIFFDFSEPEEYMFKWYI